MSNFPYADLNVLIADDFNSFRSTLSKIMYEMGFRDIDSVASGEAAYSFCKKNHYDLILCDYNLGQGKNGQQLLEELRVNELLKPQDIFILLSAEASRNVVMSAYDCEPDAYLTKPVTTKVIHQRLSRLLNKRNTMLSIYDSIQLDDTDNTIALLTEEIKQNSRYSMDCQKLLAEVYMDQKQFDKAEKLYRSVLEVRALDWAQVGLAKVKLEQGDYVTAVKWLNDIVKANPSCMKAYDALTVALSALEDQERLQKTLEQAVEISPMSIGRQVTLAKTALENGDAEVAAHAYRKTIKYGVNSCHDTAENQISFAKSVARLHDSDPAKADGFNKEAIRVLAELDDKAEVEPDLKITSQLIESQLWALQGNKKRANELMDIVKDSIEQGATVSIDIEIEIVNAQLASKDYVAAHEKLQTMVEVYKDNQAALEKIDPLLSEPVSEHGKKVLAKINKKGIDAYKAQKYDAAMKYFIRVQKRFPRYLGIKLNLAQTIIGKMKNDGVEDEYVHQCLSIFENVKRNIRSNDNQYMRFHQLQGMLSSLTSGREG
ncbi:MAG: response regulator [Pseudomonadota bacterium]